VQIQSRTFAHEFYARLEWERPRRRERSQFTEAVTRRANRRQHAVSGFQRAQNGDAGDIQRGLRVDRIVELFRGAVAHQCGKRQAKYGVGLREDSGGFRVRAGDIGSHPDGLRPLPRKNERRRGKIGHVGFHILC
jgi:hypothetical protein